MWRVEFPAWLALETVSHTKSHEPLVVIERARDSILRAHVVEFTVMLTGKRLYFQAQAIVNCVYNYFAQLEKRSAGWGPLIRTSEATGKWSFTALHLDGKHFGNNIAYA